MAQSVNIQYIINCNTDPQRDFWYAEIDGKLWRGKNGKVLYNSVGGLKSALKQSSFYYKVIRPLAANLLAFSQNSTLTEKEVATTMWRDYIGPNGRIHIKKLHID